MPAGKSVNTATQTFNSAHSDTIAKHKAKAAGVSRHQDGAAPRKTYSTAKDHIHVAADDDNISKISKMPISVTHAFASVFLPGVGHVDNAGDIGTKCGAKGDAAANMGLGTSGNQPYGGAPATDFVCYKPGAAALAYSKVTASLGMTEFGTAGSSSAYLLNALRAGCGAPNYGSMMCDWTQRSESGDLQEQIDRSYYDRTYYVPLHLLTSPPTNETQRLENSWVVPLASRYGLSYEFTKRSVADLLMRSDDGRAGKGGTTTAPADADVKLGLFAEVHLLSNEEFDLYKGDKASALVPYYSMNEVAEQAVPTNSADPITLRTHSDVSSVFIMLSHKDSASYFLFVDNNGESPVDNIRFDANFATRWDLSGDQACGPALYAMGCQPQYRNPISALSEATRLTNPRDHLGEVASMGFYDQKELYIDLKAGQTRSDWRVRIVYFSHNEIKVTRGGKLELVTSWK